MEKYLKFKNVINGSAQHFDLRLRNLRHIAGILIGQLGKEIESPDAVSAAVLKNPDDKLLTIVSPSDLPAGQGPTLRFHVCLKFDPVIFAMPTKIFVDHKHKYLVDIQCIPVMKNCEVVLDQVDDQLIFAMSRKFEEAIRAWNRSQEAVEWVEVLAS